MGFEKSMKNAGFDLIETMTRQQAPLQVWRKSLIDSIDKYEQNVEEMFESALSLKPNVNAALDVEAKESDSFEFKLGVSTLSARLGAFGINGPKLQGAWSSGKKMSIKYLDTKLVEYTMGDLEQFFDNADLKYSGELVYKHLKRDQFYIIGSVVYAGKMEITLETEHAISADLQTDLATEVSGSLGFEKTDDNTIVLTASKDGVQWPVAVKLYRIVYRWNGNFKKLALVSDNFDLF